MTESTDRASQEPKALEVVNTRLFNAPSKLIFEVSSNPQHLIHWWGPSDFTNTFQEFAFHPGGKWRFVMQGPDGKEYPQDKEFVEIIEPCCIVLRHHQHQHNFDMVMTFAQQGEGTLVTWRMVFEPSPQNVHLESFIPAANEQNFDRLEAYLKTLESN
jgi:uncharacterized protein YndB with AHSA1/START domain